MRNKVGLFSRYVVPSVISFDGSNGDEIKVGGSSRSGTVTYTGSGHTTSRVFRLNGTSGGATFDASGTGALVLTQPFTYTTGAKTLTLTGTNTDANSVDVITDAGGADISVLKTGTGAWEFSDINSYTGSTVILSGTVVVAANAPSDGNGAFGYSLNGGLGNTSSPVVVLGSDAADVTGSVTLLLDDGALYGRLLHIPALGTNSTQTVAVGGANTSGTTQFQSASTLFVNRDITIQAATGGTVQFGNGWASGEAGNAGAVTAAFTIGASGKTGTVLLSGNLSTSGSITVAYGTLKATSTISSSDEIVVDGSGAVFLFNGGTAFSSTLVLTEGTLSGTGEIATAVTVGADAIVSPGDPVGSQSFSSGLTFAGGGTYRWQINNWTGSAGTGFDQLAVSGNDLSVTATSGNKFTVKLVGLTAGNVAGAVPNFDNTTSKSFTIATAGTLDGFDATKFTIDDSEFADNNDLDGGTWSLSDSGDDIVLTFTP
jgi:autotransporter-associated beta strand protein